MKKKLISLLLTAAMAATLLAGCGSTEEQSDNQDPGTQEDDNQGDTADEDEPDEPEDPTEIVVALMSLGPMDEANSQHVEDKLNEILLDKCNVIADFQWFDGGSYGNTVSMMLSSQEKLDLMMFTPIPGAGFQSYMTQNQLMDITDYIAEYGPDIQAKLGKNLEATTKDGKIYGVGNTTSLYASATISMRKDILDQLNLTEKAQNIKSWAEYEEILKEVVDKTDLKGVVNSDAEGSVLNPQPYMLGSGTFADAKSVDVIGDTYQYVYADPATDKVMCYFENPDWIENMKMTRRFYEEGLIYKDASTSQEYGDNLIKNGVGFSEVRQTELGSEAMFKSVTGYDSVDVRIKLADVTTKSFTKFGFAVPVTSECPEAAVKCLNLMFGDQEFVDTLSWGVEGVDWVKNADGQATFPEGVTADTVSYHTADFLHGDRLMVTPWEGADPDLREQQKKTNDEMPVSKYLGFSIDPSNVTTEITACKSVVDKYKTQLSSGVAADVDKTLAEFKEALYGAGMQKIIDEYQTQLDAWLAAR